MFRGIHAVNLDTKGRMTIPARYRDQLSMPNNASPRLVITIDTEDPCLLLYPYSVWETIELKLTELSSFNQVARRIQRLLIGHATEVEVDSHGRILLPLLLRHYANLVKQVVLLGQGRKFELWDHKGWENKRTQLLEQQQTSTDNLSEGLENLIL